MPPVISSISSPPPRATPRNARSPSGTADRLAEAVFDFCRKEKLDRVVFRTRATNEPMKAVLARVGFVPAQIFYEKAIDLSDKKSS